MVGNETSAPFSALNLQHFPCMTRMSAFTIRLKMWFKNSFWHFYACPKSIGLIYLRIFKMIWQHQRNQCYLRTDFCRIVRKYLILERLKWFTTAVSICLKFFFSLIVFRWFAKNVLWSTFSEHRLCVWKCVITSEILHKSRDLYSFLVNWVLPRLNIQALKMFGTFSKSFRYFF